MNFHCNFLIHYVIYFLNIILFLFSSLSFVCLANTSEVIFGSFLCWNLDPESTQNEPQIFMRYHSLEKIFIYPFYSTFNSPLLTDLPSSFFRFILSLADYFPYSTFFSSLVFFSFFLIFPSSPPSFLIFFLISFLISLFPSLFPSLFLSLFPYFFISLFPYFLISSFPSLFPYFLLNSDLMSRFLVSRLTIIGVKSGQSCVRSSSHSEYA